MTNKILVVGSGTMGNGIAHVAALGGFVTVLSDVSDQALASARKTIEKNFDTAVTLGKISASEKKTALERLEFESNLESAASKVDFVIEAIPEKIELKKALFEKLNSICPTSTVFASNTSSLSIYEMARASKRPTQMIGMHFFNPVHKMKLIEIIVSRETSEETLARTLAVSKQMRKETVRVKESPGFVTSRMNALIGNEAFRMLEEGVASAEDIDKAIKLGLNHPMGPFEMVDLVGLDTRLAILEYLGETLGDLYRPNRLLKELVKEGRLGKKVGRGVYLYDESK